MTWLLAALLAMATLVVPSDDENPRVEERVSVEGSLDRPQDIAAFATKVEIDGVDARGEDLPDLLRRVPGARVRDYGGLGAYATMSLRASTSEQVTVRVDGVVQNRALGGPVDLSSIPATQIEEVTVYRGFSPVGLGPGGIGGLVDVRTRAPAETTTGRLDLIGGELGTARASGGLAVPVGEGRALRLGLEWLESDGDYTYLDTGATPFDPDDDVERRRENNDVEQTNLLLQYRDDRIGGGELRINGRVQQRDRGVPGVDSAPSATARLEEQLGDLNATWSRQTGPRPSTLDLQLDAFDQQIRFRDLDGNIGLAAQDQRTDLDGAGFSATYRDRRGAHGLTFRGEARVERAHIDDFALEAADRGGADRTLLFLAAEDVFRLGQVTVAPSLNWQYRSDDFTAGEPGTVPPPADDIDESALSGKLGVAWPFAGRWTLRGTIGHFFRSPNLLELFGDRGSLVGNPGLRAEEGDSVEVGVTRRLGHRDLDGSFESVVFARRTDDLIRFRPSSQGSAVADNLAEVEVVGWENAARLVWQRGLSAELGLTWQQATDVSDGFTHGNPLPYQPEWIGFAAAAWRHDPWTLRWDITYTGENSTDALDTPGARLSERWIHDASASLSFGDGWEAGIDVRNVFDRQTRDVARFPLPDRVVLLHVGWSAERAR